MNYVAGGWIALGIWWVFVASFAIDDIKPGSFPWLHLIAAICFLASAAVFIGRGLQCAKSYFEE